MIPIPFEYILPDTLEEAVSIYDSLAGQGKRPMYFAGGTEIITMGRVGNLSFDALIDIKGIPQCNVLSHSGGNIILGAALSLNAIKLADIFPLLSASCARIADHTAQCKITLGGNVAGTVIYHEAVLPLLVTDAMAVLAGSSGMRQVPLASLYRGKLQLAPGELIVQFILNEQAAADPYVHAKHTQGEKIGYPLVTIAALRTQRMIKAAVSGIYPYPAVMQLSLAGGPRGRDILRNQMLSQLSEPLLTDLEGSGRYRQKVLTGALDDMLQQLAGEFS